MLKKLFLLFITVSCFLSCGDSRRILFTMDMETDVTFSTSENTIDTYYQVFANVNTFFSSYMDNSPMALEGIGTINASQALLKGKFQSYDFDFIEDITISVIDPFDPSNKSEIFYLEFIDVNNPVELQLFPSLPDVKNIVSNDLIALEVKYNLRRSPPGNVESLLTFSLAAFEKE